MSEILEALPQLEDEERQAILRRLIEMDAGSEIEESQEMLAAIDAGIQSMDSGPGVPLAEARKLLNGWITK